MDSDHTNGLGHEETFAALHSVLLSLEGIDTFLQELSMLAGQVVSPPASCGITVEYDSQPMTVSSSDETARGLDESQYENAEGPCLQSMRSGELVAILDAEAEERWPHYLPAARRQGLRSSLSVPLIVRGEPVGAINLYSTDRVDAFDNDARSRAEMLAAQASTALLLTTRQMKVTETNQQLETALRSRSTIDQAMGILMSQQRCSADEAFGLLRTHSQHNNRKLRDVAAELVRRTTETGSDGRAPS